MRELAQLALSPDWTMAAGRTALGDGDIGIAIANCEESMVPLADAESMQKNNEGEFGPMTTELRTWLKPIGMKIAPTMSAEQCGTWLTAVTMALSDFPARIAAKAARSAIRIPMSYLNEVDRHVRAEAEKIMDRHATALRRLRNLEAEIQRAAAPLPALPTTDPTEPISPTEIRAMLPSLVAIGLKQGWITQEQVDAARSGQEAEVA